LSCCKNKHKTPPSNTSSSERSECNSISSLTRAELRAREGTGLAGDYPSCNQSNAKFQRHRNNTVSCSENRGTPASVSTQTEHMGCRIDRASAQQHEAELTSQDVAEIALEAAPAAAGFDPGHRCGARGGCGVLRNGRHPGAHARCGSGTESQQHPCVRACSDKPPELQARHVPKRSLSRRKQANLRMQVCSPTSVPASHRRPNESTGIHSGEHGSSSILSCRLSNKAR
jgi:hypothetical protein